MKSLKSGVLLCKVINVIQPGLIKKIDTRELALVHVENINNYLKACWTIGVPAAGKNSKKTIRSSKLKNPKKK